MIHPVFAQITPDSTLGAESSIVLPDQTVKDLPADLIQGGAVRGSNLFHSFLEFNVHEGQRVYFDNPSGIDRILSRVTGAAGSRILGSLGVNGSADLFFLNPNGIVFGSGAQLDLQGAFFATTANALRFEDGISFSATPTPGSLLTVNVPIGIQFGTANPAPLQIEGDGNQVFLLPNSALERSFRPAGLAVSEGKTLALLGGEVTFRGGNATAPGGNLDVGGMGALQIVGLESLSPGVWQLHYDGVTAFQAVTFTGAASLDVSSAIGDTGRIEVRGRDITIADGSSLIAQVSEVGNGEIDIQATEGIRFSGNSSYLPTEEPFASFPISPLPSSAYVETSSQDPNAQSRLSLTAPTITFRGGAQAGLGVLGAEEFSTVVVKANLIEADGDSPSAFSGLYAAVLGAGSAVGNAGSLIINTDTLNLTNGGQILNSTFGPGNAGQLSIEAKFIEVIGLGIAGPSSIQSAAESPRGGSGGTITLNTDRLLVADGGLIATSTASPNPAGDLTINARTGLEVRGQVEQGRSGLFANAISAKFEDEVFPGTGNGGNITIRTGELQVLEGATINVSNKPSNPNAPDSSPGLGAAGNLTIVADALKLNNGLLTAETVNGNTANITLDVGELSLVQGSQITTNASGQDGLGGSITINAGTVNLQQNSLIAASASASSAGNITITLTESRARALGLAGLLTLQDNSIISTQAGTAEAGGNGGNIIIDSTLIVGSHNSDIIANAFEGNGGNINITTQGLFGFTVENTNTPRTNRTNDITASSQFGVSSTPNISQALDPSQSLAVLATNVADLSNQIDRRCDLARTPNASRFVILGKGGLPATTRDLLSFAPLWTALDLTNPIPINPISVNPSPPPDNPDNNVERVNSPPSSDMRSFLHPPTSLQPPLQITRAIGLTSFLANHCP